MSYDAWKLASPEEHETPERSEWRERFDAATEMGREDARADRDPRELVGEMADHQADYEDAYTATQLEMTEESPDLAPVLSASLEAVSGGARFVPRQALPREADLHATHAQLARACREQRVFKIVK